MASIDQPVHPGKSPQTVDRSRLVVREDTLYSDAKGNERSLIRADAEDVIERLGEFLGRLIEPGEGIFYISRAQVMAGAFEQFFLGWLGSISMPRALPIFTTRQIISVRIGNKGLQRWVWDRGVRIARWEDLDSEQAKGFINRVLVLKLRNGGKALYGRPMRKRSSSWWKHCSRAALPKRRIPAGRIRFVRLASRRLFLSSIDARNASSDSRRNNHYKLFQNPP